MITLPRFRQPDLFLRGNFSCFALQCSVSEIVARKNVPTAFPQLGEPRKKIWVAAILTHARTDVLVSNIYGILRDLSTVLCTLLEMSSSIFVLFAYYIGRCG